MGVPSFFRWLSDKYTKIIVDVVEEETQNIAGQEVPVDASQPNPNGTEFDHLYLDMNGIIHPCFHPENEPQPKSEAEVLEKLFEYIDRLFAIVRPRKLIFFAIDGVAPRAKMNQQRTRRFRAIKEAKEKREIAQKLMEKMGQPIEDVPSVMDSNCITPGTEFMEKVSLALQYYVAERMNTDKAWKGLRAIISDVSVPGEGEHKIMEYIRHQKAQPGWDPNIRHVIYGLDADLIMLSLATHEPHFSVLREVVLQKGNNCHTCGQPGHLASACRGKGKEKAGEFDADPPKKKVPYQFLHLHVLREYLERDLTPENASNLNFNTERALDDFVFLCFFVGNDFLPHLPTFEIREGAIDVLCAIYKKCFPTLNGHITENGSVDLKKMAILLEEVSRIEDVIFIQRKEREENAKRKRQREREEKKKRMLQESVYRKLAKFQGEEFDGSEETLPDEDEEPMDDVQMGSAGFRERYYKKKFGCETPEEVEKIRKEVGAHYARGMCWVMQYYYQGCCSWDWYFPYHYPPFAKDLLDCDVTKLDVNFVKGKPFYSTTTVDERPSCGKWQQTCSSTLLQIDD
eukprot:TRINITY_DN2532_c0_g1_i1.p1 TRINITY_DN2532_c0_g1~~TRINITY_DN2532_c0_g1_i1.p1  ORF type:complete len:571 (-),score=88.81 TRINITY_DN2532_c0_g1_i1:312-2024(-)